MAAEDFNLELEKLRQGVALTNEEIKKLQTAIGGWTAAAAVAKAELKKGAIEGSKAMGRFAMDVGDGAKGFTQLNPIIDSVTGALGKMAEAIPFAGSAISGAMKATAEGSKFLLTQLQKTSEAFNELGQVGALTVKGMSGVQEQFLRSGMSLDAFKKSVTENATTLARFRGTVGAGADDFSKMVGSIVDSNAGKELRRIGYSADQIGETTANYVKLQTQLGLQRKKSDAELAAGAAEYAKELDVLAKLTGASRKELERQQQAALSEGRFRAQYDEMVANGQEKQAKAMLDFQSMLSQVAPELAQGMRDVSTGFTNSDAAIKLFNTTNGKGQEIMTRLQNGEIDQVQAYKQLQEAVKGNIATTRFQAKAMGDSGNVFTKFADNSNFVASEIDDLGNVLKKQTQQMQKGNDPLTDSAVNAQESLQQLNREISKLGFSVMPQATKVVEGFTSSMAKFLQWVTESTGVNTNFGGTTNTANERAAGNANGRRRASRNAQANSTGNTGSTTRTSSAGPELGEGPVFGRQDTTWNDKVLMTLTEIKDEIKNIAKMGGMSSTTAALRQHDQSHQHEPPTITPEAAKGLAQGLGSPLKNLMVTSGFGMRTDPFTGKQAGHGGVDLAGKIGDAIAAPDSGFARVVSEAQSGGYGNMVEILNDQGKVIHRMAHMSETMVKTGDKIEAGMQIGKVGSTGRSTGAHLHWEQFDPTTGQQVDPLAMLAAKQGKTGLTTASNRAGAPGSSDMNTYLKTVAMLESGGDPTAKAKTSTAGGLFGFLEGSWKGLGGTNVQDRFDPAKSTEMMAKFSAQQKAQMEKSLGRQVSGQDLYMGHFLGAGGATNFLQQMGQNPMASAAAANPAAAAANKSIFYNQQGGERSLQEVYDLMGAKYKKQEANVLSGNVPALVAGLTGGSLNAPLSGTRIAGPSPSVTGSMAPGPGMTGGLDGLQASLTNAINVGLQNIMNQIAQTTGGETGSPEATTLLAQLVSISRDSNSTLGRILQTSQA